jgi:hypothetical protein
MGGPLYHCGVLVQWEIEDGPEVYLSTSEGLSFISVSKGAGRDKSLTHLQERLERS